MAKRHYKSFTTREIKTIQELVGECFSVTEISAVLDRHPSTIYAIAILHDIDLVKRGYRRWTDREDYILCAMDTRTGKEWEILGRQLDRSADSCRVRHSRIK